MTTRSPLLTAFACFLFCAAARANVSLFPLFSDHAVLQASDHVPVWGRAAPGESVTVTLGNDAAKATATAGADGKWTATLDLHHVGEGPFDLVAAGPNNRVKAVDVLVGEVWLCSGQSNMEWILKNTTDAAKEIESSANPSLRHFLVNQKTEAAPVDTVQGHWEVSGPATAGGFTAVGYYFAKQVQATLHVPVGLIHSSWGGTPVEAWTSAEGFAACPDPELKADAAKARGEVAAFEKYLADYKAWQERFIRGDHAHDATAEYTRPAHAGEAGWTAVTLPSLFGALGLPEAGATWLQRTIPIRKMLDGYNAGIFLGDVHGSAEIYWNGKKIGGGSFHSMPSRIQVDAADLKTGDNLLAVRIFEADHGAGITAGQTKPHIDLPESAEPLDGPWLAKAEFALPTLAAGQELAPARPSAGRGKQNTTSFLYNGMIAPLVPYAMRGVLWYQGEANADRGAQYREAFPLLIADWRARWGRGDFSFYWCQLANFRARQTQPDEAGWAEVREAQNNTLKLPNTGQAILIDVGEEADIHPKDKASVGARLARLALAKDYGQKTVEWSGPVFDGLKVEAGGKVRVKFTHAGGGLVAAPIPPTYRPSSQKPETKRDVRHSPGGQLEGFVVCGADHQWHWATTVDIDGDSVVVTCTEVSAPVAVRYAWANNPLCNLANGAGLPAGPFRTDDLPLKTAKARY